MRKQKIFLKEDLEIKDFLYMHPNLLIILAFINSYCHQNEIKFTLTSLYRTEEENAKLEAKSKTHVEDRAFDFSIRSEHGWTKEKVKELHALVTKKFSKIAAVTWNADKTQLIPRPIFIHKTENGATHAHVQVKP